MILYNGQISIGKYIVNINLWIRIILILYVVFLFWV